MCVYEIEIGAGAMEEIEGLRAFDGRRVLDSIREQLVHEPTVPTRNRKLIEGVDPPFEAVPPVWELRVGEYPVFYDVNEEEKKVLVRAVRRKPLHKATEDIL